MKRHYVARTLATAALSVVLTAPWAGGEAMTKGQAIAPFTPKVRPGEYVWRPEISPAGPVVIIISLPEQVLYVYRNGVRIGRSSISSGKAGHSTPRGVFTVLEKRVKHTSSIYKGASMPYMERLTWRGIALHAGNLPGYPASHGCVRMPLDFAQKLYTVTSNGTNVIITDSKLAAGSTGAPGLLFAAEASEVAPPGSVIWKPEKSREGPMSVIVSSADSAAYVYRNGVEIGRAPVGGLRGIEGSYVYSALADVDAEGRREWLSTASMGGSAPNIKKLVTTAAVDQQFLANARALVSPGATLILTDAPVNVSTRSGSGFNILTTAGVP